MKKTLLLLSMAISSLSMAQYIGPSEIEAQGFDFDTTYAGTNAGIAFNLPNKAGNMYQMNFSKDPAGKLDPSLLSCSGKLNRFGTTGYSTSIDSTEETLVYVADGSQAETGLASNNLSVGNCSNYVLDLSQQPTENRYIKAKVKADKDDVEFTIFAAVNDQGSFAVAGAGSKDGIASQKVGTAYEDIYFRISDTTDFGSPTDFSKIIGFSIQIKGAATLTFEQIEFGSLKAVGLDEFVSNEASFSVFPNPVTNGVVNFSETVEEVELYNVQGNLVKSATNVSKLSVADLEAGIYVVQSTQGYKRIVIK